jgi:hypothetical protein
VVGRCHWRASGTERGMAATQDSTTQAQWSKWATTSHMPECARGRRRTERGLPADHYLHLHQTLDRHAFCSPTWIPTYALRSHSRGDVRLSGIDRLPPTSAAPPAIGCVKDCATQSYSIIIRNHRYAQTTNSGPAHFAARVRYIAIATFVASGIFHDMHARDVPFPTRRANH